MLGAGGFAETILGAKSWFIGLPLVPETEPKMAPKTDEKSWENLHDVLAAFRFIGGGFGAPTLHYVFK